MVLLIILLICVICNWYTYADFGTPSYRVSESHGTQMNNTLAALFLFSCSP